MKPIKQTKFGPVEGNCFEACIASLLGLPIEEVPSFEKKGGHWAQGCNNFLKLRGYCLVEFNAKDPEAGYWILRSGYSILSGPSPRGNCNHSVVAFEGTMVHDPHPDNTGILSIDTIGFICLRCE